MARITATETQIRGAYEAVKDDPQWRESCRLIEAGKLPSEMFQALAIRPDLLKALSAFSNPLYPGGRIEADLKERVIVAVSEANRCQYCVGSHAGTMKRRGMSTGDDLTPREAAALAYVAMASNNPPAVSNEVYQHVRAHFCDEEIVELTLLIGLTAMLNRFNECLDIRYNNDYDTVE